MIAALAGASAPFALGCAAAPAPTRAIDFAIPSDSIPCTAGTPMLLASRATIPAGIGAAATFDRVAFGVASGAHTSVVVEVDTVSMKARSVRRAPAHVAIGHVQPVFEDAMPGAIVSPEPMALRNIAVLTLESGATIVAWNDTDGARRGVRAFATKPGEPPVAAHWIALDAGRDEPSAPPSLAAVGPREALVVWNDRFADERRVRARVVDDAGAPVGDTFDVTPRGVDAIGRTRAEFTSDGRGLVAFFASGERTIDLFATPIFCSRKRVDPEAKSE